MSTDKTIQKSALLITAIVSVVSLITLSLIQTSFSLTWIVHRTPVARANSTSNTTNVNTTTPATNTTALAIRNYFSDIATLRNFTTITNTNTTIGTTSNNTSDDISTNHPTISNENSSKTTKTTTSPFIS
jgi:hypothetical protein